MHCFTGVFSQLAQRDGFIVSMVPPESYLDSSTSKFDQSLLHSYDDGWHPEFKYHAHNVYAYLLGKYKRTQINDFVRLSKEDDEYSIELSLRQVDKNVVTTDVYVDTFDVVLVQLYESYSHMSYNISQLHQSPSDYLYQYIQTVINGWYVDFSSDNNVTLSSQVISVPSQALLIGFCNAWGGGSDNKNVLVYPQDIGIAHTKLQQINMEPRGYFVWVIDAEGQIPPNQTEPLYFFKGLNDFLHVRN